MQDSTLQDMTMIIWCLYNVRSSNVGPLNSLGPSQVLCLQTTRLYLTDGRGAGSLLYRINVIVTLSFVFIETV